MKSRGRESHVHTEIDQIWAHYKSAKSRVGRDWALDDSGDFSFLEDSENELLGYARPTVSNRMSPQRKGLSVRRMPLSQSLDHNSNRFGDARIGSRRVPPLEMTKQLSLDLEETRRENEVLREMLKERQELIEKLKVENRTLLKKVERLSAGKMSERSKWMPSTSTRDTYIVPPSNNRSPESVSLSELSPIAQRRNPVILLPSHHSSLTYSSSTPASSKTSTPNAPAPRLNSRRQLFSTVNNLTPIVASPQKNTRITGRALGQDDPKSPAYYLKMHRPEFILHCERRQTAIKAASAARNKLCEDRRTVAKAVVEGRASLRAAKPFLQADPTVVKAFPDSEIRSATKKRFRTTDEFQKKIREREDRIEKAANKLIAHCFSLNTMRRSRSLVT